MARLRDMDARHGSSIIDAQIMRAVARRTVATELATDVAAVTAADFGYWQRVCFVTSMTAWI